MSTTSIAVPVKEPSSGPSSIAAAFPVDLSPSSLLGVAGVVLRAGIGFFNFIMFPSIFSLGATELGPLTGNVSGILNIAIVGGAVLPLIQGVIADRIEIHYAFSCL
ncbi:MAG TPA: hypothetical protein VLK33_08300 [Terriglobales bacterium]|nr:hypothetical protein [Terriglobales bacterium]